MQAPEIAPPATALADKDAAPAARRTVLGQPFDAALTREWLVTDGLGGYASGTIAGPHTRRYHGLLVAPLAPPLGRHLLLSKLEETAHVGDQVYPLASNEFEDGTIAPEGFRLLRSFGLQDGVPVWEYEVGDARLTKRVWMAHGQSTTFVEYTLHGASGRLTLVPLCAFRDFHRETIGSDDWRFGVQRDERSLAIHAYAGATPYFLHVLGDAPWTWQAQGGWWWHFLHREERERGLDGVEDLFGLGTLDLTLADGQPVRLAASIHPYETVLGVQPAAGPPAATTIPADVIPTDDLFEAQLRRAANAFLVARDVPGEPAATDERGGPEARTVLAGYHWFGDWGRDTMIALPGLAMATGRLAEARAILLAFSHYVDKGMLPNRFPDSGAPLQDGDFNTVDATLWYFRAVELLVEQPATGVDPLVEQLFPVLCDVIEWHVRGTRFGVKMDEADGLVQAENPQLTWMDAKVGDWVVTPRDGKPVEIAALWIHALGLMAQWAKRLGKGEEHARFSALRQRAADGFRRRFWYELGGYLFDTIDGAAGRDASLRPNQVIAASLPDCPLDQEQRRAVVDLVIQRLWTPRGLRTLPTSDARYKGRYSGDPWHRDGAYHQGTVWPWLLGPLVEAHLLVYRDAAAARRLITPLREHLFAEAGAGSISEIFDGDPPHAPRGCIAQAWSVAEVYRAWQLTRTP